MREIQKPFEKLSFAQPKAVIAAQIDEPRNTATKAMLRVKERPARVTATRRLTESCD